jgi:hypothetical protein
MEPVHGQLDCTVVESNKRDSPSWDSTSLEGAMAGFVGVLVELCAMGLSGRSIDSESCSTGDKTGARSESFLLTRSRSEGRVTSLGRNPSMQLSRLDWETCQCRPPAHVQSDVASFCTDHPSAALVETTFTVNYSSLFPATLHDLNISRLSIPVVCYSSEIPL